MHFAKPVQHCPLNSFVLDLVICLYNDCFLAFQLVTNAGRATTLVASDAAAPTLRRIERAAIAAATPITYPARYSLYISAPSDVKRGLFFEGNF